MCFPVNYWLQASTHMHKKKVSYFPFPSVTKRTFIFCDFAKFHYKLLVWPLYTLLKLIQENVLLCNILPRIQIIYGHSLYFTHCRFSLLHLTYFLKLKAMESKDCMNQRLRRTSVKQCLPHMTGKLRSWPMQWYLPEQNRTITISTQRLKGFVRSPPLVDTWWLLGSESQLSLGVCLLVSQLYSSWWA